MLSKREREKYSRQILVDEIGTSGQEKLKKSKVCIFGAGGLGSQTSVYLAAAGIGYIKIIDHDHVALSNLNRQILHTENDIGRRKTDSGKEKLVAVNSDIVIDAGFASIRDANAADLAAGCDVIIDALDNIETRYLLNQASLDLGIPFIHGAVNGFEGRILTVLPGQSACLRCLYHGPVKEPEAIPVIGVAPAIIGALQATEAIKYLLKIGDLLTNRLVVYDGLGMKWNEFKVKRNPGCHHCGLKRGKE